MHSNPIFLTLAAVCAGAASLATPQARAAVAGRYDIQQAADICQPATYTVTKVRNRPSGVRNESTSGIYMTCAVPGDDSSSRGGNRYVIRVTNQGGVDATVNCTMTNGWVGSVLGTFPQTATVTAGDTYFFDWRAATLNGGLDWKLAGFSCLLPPNTEINYSLKYYNEDIGS